MVIDTSAIIAIFNNEAERATFLQALILDKRRLVSTGTVLETHMVLSRLLGSQAQIELAIFLERFRIKVVAFDEKQASLAQAAFLRYGKGRHPAHLNFGDCMTYALAKQTGERLLFKGDDFGETDLLLV